MNYVTATIISINTKNFMTRQRNPSKKRHIFGQILKSGLKQKNFVTCNINSTQEKDLLTHPVEYLSQEIKIL